MFNFEQLKEILSKQGYEYKQFIGGSGFSSVFLCQSNKLNADIVIKRAMKHRQTENKFNDHLSLDHPNIIKLYDFFDDTIAHYLVIEYCSNGTIYKKGRLSYEKFVFYAKQILETIEYCHSNKIAHHHDLSPENIYIDQNDRIKISDLEITKNENNVQSMMFYPPEMILNNEICSYKADIWALGITFYFMATGHYPFQSNNVDELKKMIIKNDLNYFKYKIHPKIRQLINKMTAKNKSLRLSTSELLKLPIFSPDNKSEIKMLTNQKRRKLPYLKASKSLFTNSYQIEDKNKKCKRVTFNQKIEVN